MSWTNLTEVNLYEDEIDLEAEEELKVLNQHIWWTTLPGGDLEYFTAEVEDDPYDW